MPRELNILFPSVGRRVELIRAFKNAYKTLDIAGEISGTDIDPLAPALQEVDQAYIMPRLTSSSYILSLLELCRRRKIGLVLPLIDPEIVVLAKNSRAFHAIGTRLAVVSEDGAIKTSDKWQTVQFFHKLGLSTPLSWLPGELDPGKALFPLFIRPREGSAGQSAYRVNDATELGFFSKYVSNPIIQEYISGPEITNDVICDLSGNVLSVVSRRRIEVRWGEVAKGVTIHNPVIWESCIRVAGALPAVGPITVQCMLKDNLPLFTEINARLGGGAPLAIEAGANFPVWLMARVLGISINIPPIGTYDKDIYISRFDEARYLRNRDLEKLRNHHI